MGKPEEKIILYIGGFELPDKNAAAQRVISNAKILHLLGYKVILVGLDRNLSSTNDLISTKRIIFGFESYTLPYPESAIHWAKYLVNTNIINKIMQIYSINILVCYNYPSLALLRLSKQARRNNIKIISDCTEWYVAKDGGLLFRSIKNLDSKFRMIYVHKKLDGIISISKFLYNYYSKSCKTVLIPPLVDLNEDKWAKNNLEDINNNSIKFVYAGSPGQHKDKLNMVIEALIRQKHKNYQFDIIGLNYQDYIEMYPNHELLLKNNENIIFHGRLPHNITLDFVKKANFSIFLREVDLVSTAGFPTKFVESISLGTPVVTNKTSNISDYLISGKNGFFVNINNIEILANDFEKVFELTKKELESMKLSCQLTNTFNINNYVEIFQKFLRDIYGEL